VVILGMRLKLPLKPMQRIVLPGVFALFTIAGANGQAPFAPKIKIILLGTFHYGETTDRHSTSFPDLFSLKRQQEIEQLTQRLALQKPDKIIIEAVPKRQALIDSLYLRYQQRQLSDSSWVRNEIVQLGFRTASKTKAKLICADYRQELPYDVLKKYEEDHKQDTNPPFFDTPWPFVNTGRLKLAETDLRRYYLQLNSQEDRQRSLYDYLHYALSYGKGNDYTGVDLSVAWYSRNLKIMANVFRSLEPSDKCILLIMGSSHTAVLHQLLADHPRFEIVELTSVL
jgi:hypothetical protein